MKKLYVLILLLSVNSFCLAQKTIYESAAFKSLSKNHKTIAIIPFLATLHLSDEAISENQLKELEETEGYAVQNALETYFLKRKKRKKLSVSFQDIAATNASLQKNNITYQNIDVYTTQELAEILGVDAVISGNLTLNALISKGVSDNFNLIDYLTGKSDYGRIAIKISDGATGKLLWKYEKTITRKSGKNTQAIIESMMKQAARKFPYDKN